MDEKQIAKANYIAGLFGIMNTDEKLSKVHQLELAIFEGIDLALTKGKESIEYLSVYYRTQFFHAYILQGDNNNKILEIDTITPHNENLLKNPVPLPFLKIRANVNFIFQLIIKEVAFLNISNNTIEKAFGDILTTIGVGAKTNVGYGQFTTTAPKSVSSNVNSGANSEAISEKIPPSFYPLLVKNKEFDGIITDVFDKEVVCRFEIQKAIMLIVKKKDKIKGDVEQGAAVRLKVEQNFKLGSKLMCKITVMKRVFNVICSPINQTAFFE